MIIDLPFDFNALTIESMTMFADMLANIIGVTLIVYLTLSAIRWLKSAFMTQVDISNNGPMKNFNWKEFHRKNDEESARIKELKAKGYSIDEIADELFGKE